MTKETKVLWVLNIMPPLIGEALGQECSVKEGWISGILKRLVEEENSPCLGICFPVEASQAEWSQVVNLPAFDSDSQGKKIHCYGFYEDTQRPEVYEEASLVARFQEILQDFQPDLVHIFGTEYGHTLAMTKAFHRQERTLIGLQGIISACAKEYMADLPQNVQNQVSFRDRLKQDSMRQQQQKFALRGEREIEALKLTGNVTGRTEFDKQAALSVQPEVQYHFMNETLRKEFYTGSWSLDSCKPHRIFFSQADYPLKGFHYLLEAMGAVLQKYPDMEIAVAGNSLVSYESLKDKIKISAYGNYLRKLMKEKKLEGKIHFLGRLSPEEMKAQYLQCHTFVCASSLENSPNSVGEAMLLGVPVVASRTGGIPSMIEDGDEGLLFTRGDTQDLGEAILAVWDNDEVALRLSENGRKRALKTHDGEVNYRRLLQIYKDIIERNI